MSNTNDIFNVQDNNQQFKQPPNFNQTPPQPIYIQMPQQKSMGCGFLIMQLLAGVASFVVCGVLCLVVLGAIGATMSTSIEELSQKEKPLSEKLISGDAKAQNKIAVLTISGIIQTEEDGYIVKQIRTISKDHNVKAVVLRVDSPGGTISGSDYYLNLLKKLKASRDIPVVVSMGSVAASGGYYVSMVGDEIFAEPTTVTGSIGVIIPLFNAADLCKKLGVESTPITSGPLKNMGSLTEPLSEDERKIWQKLVDDNFAQFKSVIREGRKNFDQNPEELDKIATGQVYNATEAKDNGLIDEIGFIDDAIEKAISLTGLSEFDVKTIKYKPKIAFLGTLMENRFNANPIDAKAVSNLTTPQVYLIMPQVLPVK
ncbi:MAG: signal peptide peptidase SppA [Planctomycetaceae bacterium]|jgi:protease-4|nr:signal peptide peptidase SppA [Planctomycetaceae bacterium]